MQPPHSDCPVAPLRLTRKILAHVVGTIALDGQNEPAGHTARHEEDVSHASHGSNTVPVQTFVPAAAGS